MGGLDRIARDLPRGEIVRPRALTPPCLLSVSILPPIPPRGNVRGVNKIADAHAATASLMGERLNPRCKARIIASDRARSHLHLRSGIVCPAPLLSDLTVALQDSSLPSSLFLACRSSPADIIETITTAM